MPKTLVCKFMNSNYGVIVLVGMIVLELAALWCFLDTIA